MQELLKIYSTFSELFFVDKKNYFPWTFAKIHIITKIKSFRFTLQLVCFWTRRWWSWEKYMGFISYTYTYCTLQLISWTWWRASCSFPSPALCTLRAQNLALVTPKLPSVYCSISGWFGQLDLVTSVLFFSPAGEKYLARSSCSKVNAVYFSISGWFGQLDLVTSVLFFSPGGEKYLACSNAN